MPCLTPSVETGLSKCFTLDVGDWLCVGGGGWADVGFCVLVSDQVRAQSPMRVSTFGRVRVLPETTRFRV